MNPALLAALQSGALVVTPNRRLARWVRREFDLAQRDCGLSAWPTPPILPYPQWLEMLWDEAIARHGEFDQPLLLTPSQSALQWRQIVDADADRVPLLDVRGAAAVAAEAWSLVHQWGSGGESWRAWSGSAGAPDDPAVFARWAETYLARMRAAGACDLALAPDALARATATLPRAGATVLAGFIELTPQHRRLLAALRAAGADVRTLGTLPEVPSDVSRTSAATARDELAAALAWARGVAIARPQARIGIVIEDLIARREEVSALAQEVLCPAAALDPATSSAFEISLGPELAEVPLVATAIDLIALAEGPLPMGAAAALLRSPYLSGAQDEWSMRARAEVAWIDEGKLQVTLADAIAALDRSSPELAARWRAGRDLFRSRRRSTPREWSDAWRAWLSAAGWPGQRPLDSAEYQARVAWERLLVEFAALGVIAPRFRSARALATLQTLSTEQRFQPEGGPAPIAILGALEGAGIAFDALWVAGLASDRWPSAPSPNPLLALAWQRDRNVAHATAKREREYAETITSLFARSAREVVFSSPRSIDEHELSPSALILAYPARDPPPPPEAWAVAIARSRQLDAIADERAPAPMPGSRVSGGSRIVVAQSDCPFQAVIRCRLRTEPWPAPCAGLTPRERGAMVHVALAEFWGSVGDQQTLLALDDAEIASRIGTAVGRALAEVTAERWRALPAALREGEEQRIDRLVREWLDMERLRPPFVVKALETRTLLQLSGLEFALKIDRVDALSGGGSAVLDYKTGLVERPRQWFDARPRAAQIGLYTLARRAVAPEEPVRAAAYVELRPGGVAVAGIAADDETWPELDLAAQMAPERTWSGLEAWWRERLGALAAEIAAGDATVAPRLAPSPCRNCGLQPICRIESVRVIDPGDPSNE
jgi:probable DNA repair protein